LIQRLIQEKEPSMRVWQVMFLSTIVALTCLVMSPIWAGEHKGHVTVTPADLQWADVPSLPPGAKIAVIEGPLNEAVPFTFRVKLPANYKIPAHSHPASERITVLSGTFNIGAGDTFDQAKTKALPVGSVSIMEANTNHFAWTTEETIVQLNGVGPWGVKYVNPADDPRKK
jgi:quercetin dioxygenase-like cupin family protein